MQSKINVNELKSEINDCTVWLADLTYTQQTVAADVIPNAIGGIATYTEDQLGLSNDIPLFKYPENLIKKLEDTTIPKILGFSNYIWNFELSYSIASAVKHKSPDTIIVFGGPNYPTTSDEQEEFLRTHPIIDFYIIKEAELAFKNLVLALMNNSYSVETVKNLNLSSVHSIDSEKQVHLNDAVERITDLSEIPSPYTLGKLDEFFDGVLLPIIQTNRGCPFQCTFCVEGVDYYNKVRKNSVDKTNNELEYIAKKMKVVREQGGRNDLFIADSNFGMYKEDINTAEKLAETRLNYAWPEYINVATGKNQKERVLKASKILGGALRLSGSVQSLDKGVLDNIKRKNINEAELFELGLSAAEVGANTYSEIILALPGDSLKAHFKTIKDVVNAGFNNVYLFQLMLLPGTEMATEVSKKQYGMDIRYRVLPRCYGNYVYDNNTLVSAEIEEICVANNTLAFEDYLTARQFHLLVTIFYNDGIFSVLLKLLLELKVDVFSWLEKMSNIIKKSPLNELFERFKNDTQNELWTSKSDLEEYIKSEGMVERYIAGQEGNNLLFIYKTEAIISHVDLLSEVAKQSILECLSDVNKVNDKIENFIDDALIYHCLRTKNIFFDRDVNPSAKLSFDILRYDNDKNPEAFETYEFDKSVEFTFQLDNSQKDIIQRFLSIYGESNVGIGRILSKVHTKKLFRQALAEGVSFSEQDPSYNEKTTNLAGLQN